MIRASSTGHLQSGVARAFFFFGKDLATGLLHPVWRDPLLNKNSRHYGIVRNLTPEVSELDLRSGYNYRIKD